MEKPRVSVVMSVYNGERYLREAVESILGQTFTDFEFLIIDDASTDTSSLILDAFEDPRIVRSSNEENLGLTRSLNRGLAVARGEYIARMDADDVSLPERFAKQIDFLDAHPEVGVVGSSVLVVDRHGIPRRKVRRPAEHDLIRWRLCFSCPIAHPTVMMRTTLLQQVSGYTADVVYSQDYDLWRRLGNMTRFANLQDVLLHLRKHDANVTHRHATQHANSSYRVTQRIVSDLVGERIPIRLIRGLRGNRVERSTDVLPTSKVICDLVAVFARDPDLSEAERRVIRRDAAARLSRLIGPRFRDPRVWQVARLALHLDPWLLARVPGRRFRRMLRIYRSRIRRGLWILRTEGTAGLIAVVRRKLSRCRVRS